MDALRRYHVRRPVWERSHRAMGFRASSVVCQGYNKHLQLCPTKQSRVRAVVPPKQYLALDVVDGSPAFGRKRA